jgi:protein HIRA/HIR1
MQLTCLAFGASHSGTSIFSIDVHPSGKRFVTAGADQKVKVWNLVAAIDAHTESDNSVPRLLASLTDHFAPVNVARFAANGRFLASGSDDKLVSAFDGLLKWCISGLLCHSHLQLSSTLHQVILYELRAGPGQTVFGSGDGPNLENWKHIYTLRGHYNNVLDVSWSPDDRYIASCSVDNQARRCSAWRTRQAV